MPYNEKSKKNLKPFKEGESGNPKGRPKKLVSSVLSELEQEGYEEVTSLHVKEAYQRLINLDEDKLRELQTDTSVSMLIRIVAENILGGKGFEIIEKMLDRAQGKATQKTEVTGKDGEAIEHKVDYDFDKLSIEQLEQLERIAIELRKDPNGPS